MIQFMMAVLQRTLILGLIVGLVPAGCLWAADGSGVANHPLAHRDEVAAFTARNRDGLDPLHGLVFAGSSNIRLWRDLARQFAPIPTVNRGYGGARSWELSHDLDTVVLALRPRVVVYSVGVNDPALDPDATGLATRISGILDQTHAALPDTRIIYLSIMRTPARARFWTTIEDANRLIASACSQRPWTVFLDTNPVFVDADGNPDLSLYVSDQQHLTGAAYAKLAEWIRPTVLTAWNEAQRGEQP